LFFYYFFLDYIMKIVLERKLGILGLARIRALLSTVLGMEASFHVYLFSTSSKLCFQVVPVSVCWIGIPYCCAIFSRIVIFATLAILSGLSHRVIAKDLLFVPRNYYLQSNGSDPAREGFGGASVQPVAGEVQVFRVCEGSGGRAGTVEYVV
jgi:hypothetical protein